MIPAGFYHLTDGDFRPVNEHPPFAKVSRPRRSSLLGAKAPPLDPSAEQRLQLLPRQLFRSSGARTVGALDELSFWARVPAVALTLLLGRARLRLRAASLRGARRRSSPSRSSRSSRPCSRTGASCRPTSLRRSPSCSSRSRSTNTCARPSRARAAWVGAAAGLRGGDEVLDGRARARALRGLRGALRRSRRAARLSAGASRRRRAVSRSPRVFAVNAALLLPTPRRPSRSTTALARSVVLAPTRGADSARGARRRVRGASGRLPGGLRLGHRLAARPRAARAQRGAARRATAVTAGGTTSPSPSR